MIQLLLLSSTALLVAYFIGNRKKARAKAGVKLGFILFILASIYAVLHPDHLTWVANLVGVARGTDLLLYGLVVAFMFTTLSTYIRFREQELRYARLARAVALQNAIRPEDEYPGTSA
ncbi:membrane protein [Corynebacterium aquilae DSM 44791]|uniref:Membrane protein n=1 Tax=Corynebacterium aquilae DSM 44791 TaxID=1431546 RepID=A0A1L7CDG9_9CORY|nr:membrane protein [Corynebacterium aquilae DSM 44791]